MITDYSSINDDYKELTEYINNIYFPNKEGSIQEHLFQMGLEFCNERPKFYTECESFWNYYIREFYDRMYYIFFIATIRNKKETADNHIKTYNLTLELPDFIRGDIFIEYSTKIDQKINPKTKIIQSGTKKKKVHLK
jgi:hypothetical protein